MTEEIESQQEDTYLLKLRRRALFRDASSTMTIAESPAPNWVLMVTCAGWSGSCGGMVTSLSSMAV